LSNGKKTKNFKLSPQKKKISYKKKNESSIVHKQKKKKQNYIFAFSKNKKKQKLYQTYMKKKCPLIIYRQSNLLTFTYIYMQSLYNQ